MNAIWIVVVVGAVFLGSVLASLVGDEVKGWVGRVPYAVLWVASRRVPASHHKELYEDWIADLAAKLQDKSERPITRVVFGVRFAASLVRGGRQVAVELGPVHRDVDQRPQAGTATGLTFSDSVGLSDSELGLAPIELIEPALWITFTSPRWGELDGPPLDATRRYRLPTDPSGLAVSGASSRPFVYATLGTVWNTTRRLLKAFIAAIDDGGWWGLVTVGRTNDPARFERPARVAVERYVPQADILALTDVMVCHGGLGSMLGAMGAGCPMVVVPLGADQLDNASKAQRMGIARVVHPPDATPETLRAAIVEVLESRTQREPCDRLQHEVATMPGLHELTAELQRLVP